MDPYSRRSTWSIIQKHKKGRIILLTTHYMDEADLLGDRIAIMSHGRLICCGSPLYLKNKYGVGYTLTVVKTITAHNTQQKEQEISSNIDSVVKNFVADAETLSDIGAELSMRLPFSASSTFVDLFHTLDARKEVLGIAEYGISVTTLEEVFLRVGHDGGNTTVEEESASPDHTHNATLDGSRGSTNPVGIALTSSMDLQGEDLKHQTESEKIPSHTTALIAASDENLFGTHFWTLMKKRAIYGKRDRKMLFCQLVLPVFLVIIGLSLLLLKPDLNQPDYVLSPKQFNPTMNKLNRNFVPINLEQGCGTICTDIAERFNGDEDNGVYGVYVSVNDVQLTEDSFDGCAQGAAVLEQTSQYLLQTPDDQLDKESGSSRYGALTIGELTSTVLLNYNALVNGSAVHGVGIYMNLIHQAFLQVVTTTPTAQIITHNHPLPQTYKQENESATADAFVVALFAMIAVCFIPTSFVVFVVKEREIKAKHQQVISGVSLYAYWISTYLWDVVSYIPTALLIFAMMFAFDIKAYITGDAVSIMFIGLLIYGPSTAAITYLLSFMFKSHSTSQVAIMFFNFLTGLCLMIVSFILTYIPSTTEINVSLRYVFRLFPAFCLGDIFTQLSICTEGSSCPAITKDGYDFDHMVSPWDWNTAGANLTFMAIQSVVYFLIALGIEIMLSYPAILASLNPVNDPGCNYEELVQHEDIDVHAERERVLHDGARDDIIRLEQLRKVYPTSTNFFGLLYNVSVNVCKLVYRRCCGSQPFEAVNTNTSRVNSTQGNNTQTSVKVAVQCLSFGIPKGECFGFLGINGAGKTTTLSILSGELTPTAGKAFIHGYDIIYHQQRIRQLIGYCPQFDALFELLTVREHLDLYANIKGLSKLGTDECSRLIEKKMIEMNLTLYSDKLAGSLSGGNKRKLSVAIATIADPPIVFLDEPSSGMDPVARRFMWKVIARMSTLESRCSVMLTTHSMEEAEALCSRIGVMVNGQLQCLGSAQHLKHRFGQGFELTLKLLTPPEDAVHQMLCQLRDARLLTRTGQATHQHATSPLADIEGKGRLPIA
ncbi:ATP-binding cassette domain-containing protein [archaeon]|nr:MAG: ATP-binding cassette domain-containing protein [archaeon]